MAGRVRVVAKGKAGNVVRRSECHGGPSAGKAGSAIDDPDTFLAEVRNGMKKEILTAP